MSVENTGLRRYLSMVCSKAPMRRARLRMRRARLRTHMHTYNLPSPVDAFNLLPGPWIDLVESDERLEKLRVLVVHQMRLLEKHLG